MKELSKREGASAQLLQLTILTCLRSNEARGIKWQEIAGDTWNVPSERMKDRLSHRVPLSTHAQRILKDAPRLDERFVFPSPTSAHDGRSRGMSNMVFKALMDRMGAKGITAHGFRTTFRVWSMERAKAEWDVCEKVLSHKVGNAVERAYARSDLIDARRVLMQQWSDFAMSAVDEEISRLLPLDRDSAEPKPKRRRRIVQRNS